MRLLLLFLSLFLFEKNAVAVVHSAAGNHVQFVENQPVKLSDRLSKTNGHHFLEEKTELAFFKKRKSATVPHVTKFSPGNAKLSLIFGLLAFAAAFFAVGTLSGAFFLLWLVFWSSGLAFGAIAISEKEKRKIAWLGVFLSAASAIFCVLLYIIAWSGD